MRINNKNIRASYDVATMPMAESVCAICEDEVGIYNFRGQKICQHCLSFIKSQI